MDMLFTGPRPFKIVDLLYYQKASLLLCHFHPPLDMSGHIHVVHVHAK
jgi:hypothetical protein